MVSCMRTGDGGIISDATIITHGVALSGEHALFSQGMVYKDSNTLFMTFMLTSPTMRSKGSISDYAGHFYVARIDPISHTQVWRKEMERFGYSASLVYKDWGTADSGNLLVGGALDYSRWTGNESNINWRLAIMRITEDGG